MPMTDEKDSSFWAIVELMGHHKLVGELRDVNLAGNGFLRIDIPATRDVSAWSKYLSPQSIYAVTPIDEALARAMAEQLVARPITSYSVGDLGRDLLQEARQRVNRRLMGPLGDDDDGDDDDGDDIPI